MAAELPGWCKQCGQPLIHQARAAGRARAFCSGTCRQRHSRQVRLRRTLRSEVGLNDQQVERLLALFRVTPR